MRTQIDVVSILTLLAIAGISTVWPPVLWSLILIGPLVILGLYDMLRPSRTIVRNFRLSRAVC